MSAFKRSPHYERWMKDQEQYWHDISYHEHLEHTYLKQLGLQRSEREACSTDHPSKDDTTQSRRWEEVQSQKQELE